MNKHLIIGVLHNILKVVIDDICTFNAQVEDFRVVEKTNLYTQIYFQVHAVVLPKMLINDGKEIFKENNLSILLKRTKAKGWNRKIRMLLDP